jgi:hypothetical protein
MIIPCVFYLRRTDTGAELDWPFEAEQIVFEFFAQCLDA